MDKRFVIVNNEVEVSVIDTQNDVTTENLLMFSIDCVNKEDANYIAEELEGLVCALNEQDMLLKHL